MCRVFKVSRSSYYYWLKYPIGKRSQQIKEMENRIQAVYFKAKGRYGSPRIREELCKSGTDVSLPTVAKYMKRMGLKSKYSRKYKPTTDSSHKEPVADNILNRDFTSFSPSSKCVSDITYLPTKDGFLYLTIVMDLFNRDIIGWTLSPNMTAQDTVIAAINKATTNSPFQNDMIFHSDRVIQYIAKATVNMLRSYKVIQSMSRKENCWDNAVAETFFKSLKTGLLYGYKLMDKKQMRLAIFEYIEVWYRKQRRHSYLDYQTIEEFNEQYRKQNIKYVA